jgi:hypothetical protein
MFEEVLNFNIHFFHLFFVTPGTVQCGWDFDRSEFISCEIRQEATQSMPTSQWRDATHVRVRARDELSGTRSRCQVDDQTGRFLFGWALVARQHGGERLRDVHRNEPAGTRP